EILNVLFGFYIPVTEKTLSLQFCCWGKHPTGSPYLLLQQMQSPKEFFFVEYDRAILLAVQAKGFAPDVQTLQMTGDTHALGYQMCPRARMNYRSRFATRSPIPSRLTICRTRWWKSAQSSAK